MNTSISTLVLTKHTGWYGAHSGYYERLAALLGARPGTRVLVPSPPGFWRRAVGALHNKFLGCGVRDTLASHVELRMRLAMLTSPGAAGLVLNLDDHLPMLRWWSRAPRRLVGVVHLPPSVWSQTRRRDLARLSSAIAPWRAVLPELETLVGTGRARFVPHGVDTEFFRPGGTAREPDHLLLCGQYLRDFPRAERVFKLLRLRRPALRFTLVVPAHRLRDPRLEWCAGTPGVSLVSGLDDAALRELYQRCTALLLPLTDSGANNTLLEALACGLPIATNDVGGVRDYGGGSVFPLPDRDDDESLADLVENYLRQPALRASVSTHQRALAETLAWEKVLPLLERALTELAR